MVSTIQIKPALPLQPFVNCYALRTFNTGNFAMPKPLHAVNEFFMSFFLKEQYCTIVSDSGVVYRNVSNSLATLLTESQGCIYWKGDYRVFFIQFTSNGISSIFGIAQKALINTVLTTEDILGDDNRIYTERLAGCTDIFEMGRIMNTFLTRKLLLRKHKAYTLTIAAVANVILQSKGRVQLDNLVLQSNMSCRNFERRFSDEVGMSPKLYVRVTRFYNAVKNKMLHPSKTWTDITYENGYYDQAHFIRECKEFSGKTPEELFTVTPPPIENFVFKAEA